MLLTVALKRPHCTETAPPVPNAKWIFLQVPGPGCGERCYREPSPQGGSAEAPRGSRRAQLTEAVNLTAAVCAVVGGGGRAAFCSCTWPAWNGCVCSWEERRGSLDITVSQCDCSRKVRGAGCKHYCRPGGHVWSAKGRGRGGCRHILFMYLESMGCACVRRGILDMTFCQSDCVLQKGRGWL